MNLNGYKSKCSRETIIKWFIKSDHFKVGLDNGGTIPQIMNDLGFKNPTKDEGFEILAKLYTRSCLNSARKYFARNGFILASKKIKHGTPAIHYLVNNLSDERVERHYKLKRRVETSSTGFREDKLCFLELMDRITDQRLKEHFQKAYASRPSIAFDENKVQKLLAKPDRKPLKLESENK